MEEYCPDCGELLDIHQYEDEYCGKTIIIIEVNCKECGYFEER